MSVANKIDLTNHKGVKPGDVIEFNNKHNYKIVLHVIRVTDKSCFTNNDGSGRAFRESWGTINSYFNLFNAKIIEAAK